MTQLNEGRRFKVTGSNLGTYLGLNPHCSAQEGLSRTQTGHVIPENDAMVCGKYLEPMLFRMAEIGPGGLKASGPVVPWPQENMLTSAKYPWAAATPDAVVGNRFSEFKTTSQNIEDLADCPSWHIQLVLQIILGEASLGMELAGDLHVFHVPREMQQAVAMQARLGAPLAQAEALLADFLRVNYRRFPVAVSAQLVAFLDQVGSEIHRRFIIGNEKPEKWKPPTKQVLALLYGGTDGSIRKLSEEEERDVIDMCAIKTTLSDLKAREKALRKKLILHLKGASKGEISDNRTYQLRKVFKRGYVSEVAAHYEDHLYLPKSKDGD